MIKSGTYCKCNHCNYKGCAYGIPYGRGISAPFCNNCGKNDELLPIVPGKEFEVVEVDASCKEGDYKFKQVIEVIK